MIKEAKKIGKLVKERMAFDLKEKITGADGCFFINFNKVQAFQFNRLRNDLTKAGAKVLVTKNSLFKRVFDDLGWKDQEGFLEQKETGAVLVSDKDVVEACKLIVNFAKENEILEIKGAQIDSKKMTVEQLQVMAKLPSREVLLGMVVSGLAAPISGFARCLNQVTAKFVWAVEEIRKKKDKK